MKITPPLGPVKPLASLGMAKRKKSRTPAPPRRPAAPRSEDGNGAQPQPSGQRAVQAPQVRSGKKRTQADTERRNRMILYGIAGAGVVGLVVALLAVFVLGRSSTSSAHFDGPAVDFANLPGLMRTPPPWPKNSAGLDARAKASGVQILPTEGVTLHIHQHLDIFNNGKRVPIPALIGIKRQGNGYELAELHTHSNDGIIHLESERTQAFSLGQFFAVWGLYLAKNCVGSLCSPPNDFSVYVNGTKIPATADPTRLVLQEHDEVAIVYGTPPSNIPSSFNWDPSGL
jgi:hypothetical protein